MGILVSNVLHFGLLVNDSWTVRVICDSMLVRGGASGWGQAFVEVASQYEDE